VTDVERARDQIAAAVVQAGSCFTSTVLPSQQASRAVALRPGPVDRAKPPVPTVFVILPFETVGRILYLAEGGQAATPVGPAASAPDAKQLPQLRASVVATLRRADLRYGGRVEYDVMLERDDAIALRDWCREVAPLVPSADTGLFLAAADAISFETLR
jgi:hypothetical protein